VKNITTEVNREKWNTHLTHN